jgi:hypothetical protein
MKIFRFEEFNEGALPQQQTVNQWQNIRKLTKGIDIGDKISDMNKQGANIQYIHNALDTGVESYQDYQKNNKNFEPNWNLKRLNPFHKKISGKKKIKKSND